MTPEDRARNTTSCVVCGETTVTHYALNQQYECGAFYNPTLDNWSGNCENAFTASTVLREINNRLISEKAELLFKMYDMLPVESGVGVASTLPVAVAALTNWTSELRDKVYDLKEQVITLKDRVKRLREALEKYGKHSPSCKLDMPTYDTYGIMRTVYSPCDCGLAEALRK